MKINHLSFDDFHRSPLAIQRVAKTLTYGPQEHEGHTYHGIGLGYEVEGMDSLIAAVVGAASAKVDMEFFRLGVSAADLTDYIHADSSISRWAAVWYLSEAPKGVVAGTAFWRHKGTGLTEMPTDEWIVKNFSSVPDFVKMIRADANDESKWEMTDLVGQKFNRLVFYPTQRFHSRFPQQAWGKDVSDGRLVWTGFLTTNA